MSDSSEKKLLTGKFFTFIRPFLSFVDSPKYFTVPFSWLYILFAVVYLASPLVVLFKVMIPLFEYATAKIVFSSLLTWVALAIAAWAAFQVWWNRRKTIETYKIDAKIIIGALSHFVYTSIEATAIFIGIAGFFAGLFALLIDGGVLDTLGLKGFALSIMIGSLLGGYFGVWIAKLVAFLFRKITEIIVFLIVKLFHFIVYAIVRIFNFDVHIIKQLFEYGFLYVQSIVDFIVNGWRVVIALVAKLGNFLLAIAHAPIVLKSPSKASITYNND
jgi:hypothetical protein